MDKQRCLEMRRTLEESNHITVWRQVILQPKAQPIVKDGLGSKLDVPHKLFDREQVTSLLLCLSFLGMVTMPTSFCGPMSY